MVVMLVVADGDGENWDGRGWERRDEVVMWSTTTTSKEERQDAGGRKKGRQVAIFTVQAIMAQVGRDQHDQNSSADDH